MRITAPTGKRIEAMSWAGVNFDDFGTRSVHFDAASPDNFSLNGTQVTRVHDLAGNGNDIPIADTDWLLTPDVASGLHKMTMGANAQYTVGDWAAAPTQDSTFFAVMTKKAKSQTTPFGTDGLSHSNRLQAHLPYNNNIYFDHGDISNGGRVQYTTDAVTGETYVWMMRHRWTIGDMTIRRGGRNKVYEAHRSATAFNPAGLQFQLGFGASDGIELKELIIYSTPIDDKYASFIERILRNKWRIRNY